MQFVSIGSACSSTLPLNCGIPQGSALDLLLFLFLLSHWWHKTIGWRHHNVSFHLYADNTLLYVSFESSILGDLSMARHTPHWNPVLMIPINVCDTLMMVRQRCWLSMLRTILLSSFISFKWPLNCSLLASAKNIGVVLNSMLSLDNHIITQICKYSFYST